MTISKVCMAILAMMMMVMMVAGQTYESYEGWQVVRVNLEHEKHVQLLSNWELDVWSRDSVLGVGLKDIRVNKTHVDNLKAMEMEYEVIIEDVESLVSSERASLAHRNEAADWFAAFHTYSEIVTQLKSYASSYPSLVTYNASIGKTIQGNSIPSVVLSGSGNNKKKIFWSCQQHAREWIASHTCMYMIDQLVTKYATDSSIKALLDKSIIHIVPLSNPDGYLYSWSSSRLWRKNRRANNGGTYGVDLNRNWNDHWGGEGSSGTPSSDTYRGTKAFSEPETVAISSYVLLNGPFSAGIDWHSYSQLILRPYGWSESTPYNEKEAKHVGDTMADKIYSVHKKQYDSIASWELYPTTGSAQDWYFSEASIPLRFIFLSFFLLSLPISLLFHLFFIWSIIFYFFKN
eukprot:TRINITY_DN5784_c0_g1_i2.p1 TRINITY_DN5784_c0_g1~~TRINITY_DN5784_c0_g1_i2.p1  ORF type:complete len:403 (-),score=89.33 TRINITY_DN5784_c0_g1_i2:63-1271(-)